MLTKWYIKHIKHFQITFHLLFELHHTVEANSISIPSASRGQRSVDEEAYFMDDAEEGQDEMEERQVETSVEAKRINKLWKKANPIAWTIKRL